MLAGCLALPGMVWGQESLDPDTWGRVTSRYSTILIHPTVEVKQVNKRISTWRVRPRIKAAKGETYESELAAKFDTIFRRAQEILDMYPAGVHTTIKIVKEHFQVTGAHANRYGHGTNAVAFYDFEKNTIYVAVKDLSESVLAHEMAHCIIDHYFQVRPPRKIEELLAMHVDEQLRD